MSDPMTPERLAEIREHVAWTRDRYNCVDDFHHAGARGCVDLLAEVERLRKALHNGRAERDRLREQLAAFVPPGALGAGETPALCGTCKDRLCVPGLPGCARCVKAELAETTHALTVTGEKATALRKQRDAAEDERDAVREQVKRVRALHVPHECGDPDCDQQGDCDVCDEPHPCHTVRALGGTEPGQ